MSVRNVVYYVILNSTRYSTILELPAFTDPITGDPVALNQYYGNMTMAAAEVPVRYNVAGDKMIVSGEWTLNEAIGFGLLADDDSTGTIMTFSQMIEEVNDTTWTPEYEEE